MSWEYFRPETPQQAMTIYHIACDFIANGNGAEVRIREAQDNRRDAQNALQFHWFKEMEMQGDKSAKEWRAQCKLELGVPIARECEEFRGMYDPMIRPLPYPTKLALMVEPFDARVTRNFTIKNMCRYLQEIEQFAAKCGFRLTTSQDLYHQAMGITQ